MKKGFFIGLLSVLLTLVAVTPAFAGDLNSNEEKLWKRFDEQILSSFESKDTNFKHRKQYSAEAKSALMNDAIDLDSAAYDEFDALLDDIQKILDSCKTQGDAWAKKDEIIGAVNKVANKYNMEVQVDPTTHDATVLINGKPVASTGNAVNQTGFAMGQSALVVAAAAVALGGALVISRKNKIAA